MTWVYFASLPMHNRYCSRTQTRLSSTVQYVYTLVVGNRGLVLWKVRGSMKIYKTMELMIGKVLNRESKFPGIPISRQSNYIYAFVASPGHNWQCCCRGISVEFGYPEENCTAYQVPVMSCWPIAACRWLKRPNQNAPFEQGNLTWEGFNVSRHQSLSNSLVNMVVHSHE